MPKTTFKRPFDTLTPEQRMQVVEKMTWMYRYRYTSETPSPYKLPDKCYQSHMAAVDRLLNFIKDDHLAWERDLIYCRRMVIDGILEDAYRFMQKKAVA